MKTTRNALLLVSLLLAGLTGCAVALEEDEVVGQSDTDVSGRPYFEVWRSSGGYYFHFVAANHEIILASQSYSSRTAALGGVLSVLDNAVYADRYEILRADNGEWYFNLEAANGRVIGTSELYRTRAGAESGAAAVDAGVGDYVAYQATRTGARFEVFEGSKGYYFNLRSRNGAIVLQSESYSSEAAALNGTFSVADNGVDAARYDIRQSANGGYYFNLKASNGQVIGTSEVYDSKWNAERARDSIIAFLPEVELL